jgi:hypothetical protein
MVDTASLEFTIVSTPSVSEAASSELRQLYPQAIDANQEWEIREITGEESIDGVLHYLVERCPTLIPEDSIGMQQSWLRSSRPSRPECEHVSGSRKSEGDGYI